MNCTPTRYSSSLPNAYLLPPTPLATSLEEDNESVENESNEKEQVDHEEEEIFHFKLHQLHELMKKKESSDKRKVDKFLPYTREVHLSFQTKFLILSPSG